METESYVPLAIADDCPRLSLNRAFEDFGNRNSVEKLKRLGGLYFRWASAGTGA